MYMSNSFPTIHIWDLPFKNKISIQLKKDFLINSLLGSRKNLTIKEVFERIKPIGKSYSTFRNYMKPSYPCFIPFHVAEKLCDLFGIVLSDLERNIVSYSFLRSRIIITKPKLPIKINPIFDMIIAHLMGDGNCVRFKTKDTVYSSYRQYDKELRLLFLKKLESIFGKLEYPTDYFIDGTRIYVPEVITLILLNEYNLTPDNLLSLEGRVPKNILEKGKINLIAFLTAFIIDEGSIGSSQINIRLANKDLIHDLKIICDKLGYKNKTKQSRENMWDIWLNVESTRKYYSDYLLVKIHYPQISLGPKEEALHVILKRTIREWRDQGRGVTKNQIIKILKKGDLSMVQLSRKLKITRQGVRYHINEMEKMGIVATYKGRRGYIVKLLKNFEFEENLNIKSRPLEKTRNEILNLLEGKNRSTKEIAAILPITHGGTRIHLNRLEKSNLIKKVGKKNRNIIWSLI